MRFFWRACGACAFMASSVPHVAATPPLLPTLTVYLSWGTWIGFLGLCGIWSFVFPEACAPIPLTVPAPVLVVALRSVAEVAAFSPNARFLSLVWGFLLLLTEFSRLWLYSLAALVGWPFRSVCLSYTSTFACGCWPCGFSLRISSLVVPACVCGSFLGRRSCVFFLSSCSARGGLLLSLLLVLLLCLFLRRLRFSAACPAAVYPWGLSHLSGSSCLSCSCACGVAFSLRMPILHFDLRLRLLALWVFAADLIPGCPCVCVWVLSGAAELCLLSLLLLGTGWAIVEPLTGVVSVPLPAAPAVFRGVSCRSLPLGVKPPFWLQLPVLLLRWSSVCWACGVFGASLGFLPCAVLFLRGLRFALLTLLQVDLGGFCLFWHRLPDLLLRWWCRLGGNPSLMLSVLLLHRLACRGWLGSAPCVRELP